MPGRGGRSGQQGRLDGVSNPHLRLMLRHIWLSAAETSLSSGPLMYQSPGEAGHNRDHTGSPLVSPPPDVSPPPAAPPPDWYLPLSLPPPLLTDVSICLCPPLLLPLTFRFSLKYWDFSSAPVQPQHPLCPIWWHHCNYPPKCTKLSCFRLMKIKITHS